MSTILPIRASGKKPWKRIPFSHWISVLLISAFTSTLCLRSDTLAAPVDAAWNSGTGVWSDLTKWDIGSVPTNGAGSTYNIFIDEGVSASSVVSLDIDATISNLSISTGDALSVSLGKTLNIAGGAGAGTLTNEGTFTLRGSSDPSTGSTLTILGNSTLQGAGSMTLEEHSAILRDMSTISITSSLNNASGHTIQGAGYIGGIPSAVNGGPGLNFTNYEGGVVRANVSGKSLVLSTITASYNAGTMEATGGGILLLTGSGAENRYYNAAPGINGVIQAKDGSRVELAGVYIDGGIFTTEGSGVIRTVNTGTREGATLRGITNRGAFETGLGTTNFLTSTLTNEGTFHVTVGSTLVTDPGSTYRQMSGTTTIDGIVNGSGTMIITGGLLNGTGDIQVGVDLSGTLAPGNSIGTLRIADYTQRQDGVLSIEIGGLNLYDQLLAGNSAALDGTLDIQLFGGFTPGAGDEFRIMTFGSFSGAFDIFQGMDIGGGLYFDPVFSDTAFTLVVRNSGGTAPVPEPGTMLLVGSGLAGLLGYGRRWTKK